MLMHGGTMTSGRLCTVGVVASYWMSSISALRNTTLPGVTARLRPTANARSSVIVIRPRRVSSTRLRSPFTRLSPSVATAFASTSGLVAGKFVGAMASTYWRVANSRRCLSAGGSGASRARSRRYSAYARYDCMTSAKYGCSRHALARKRRSPGGGATSSGSVPPEAAASAAACHNACSRDCRRAPSSATSDATGAAAGTGARGGPPPAAGAPRHHRVHASCACCHSRARSDQDCGLRGSRGAIGAGSSGAAPGARRRRRRTTMVS